MEKVTLDDVLASVLLRQQNSEDDKALEAVKSEIVDEEVEEEEKQGCSTDDDETDLKLGEGSEKEVKKEECDPLPEIITHSTEQIIAVCMKYTLRNPKKELGYEKETVNPESDVRLIVSQRGAPLIIFQNQIYKPSYEDVAKNVISRCDYLQSCKGKIKTNRSTGETEVHTPCHHPPRWKDIMIRIAKRQALLDSIGGLPATVAVQRIVEFANTADFGDMMPKSLSISQCIRRNVNLRNQKVFPPVFDWETVQDKFKVCNVHDDTFSYILSGNCKIMWSFAQLTPFIENAKTIHFEGKLTDTDAGFQQMLIVNTEVGAEKRRVPLFFSLFSRIDADLYTEIFTAMANTGLTPETVYCDFEAATSTAARRVWPDSDVKFSYQHWKASIRSEMKKALKSDDERPPFRRVLQALYSLAFAKKEQYVEIYQSVCKHAGSLDNRLADVMSFVNKMYIGDKCTPMFEYENWSCYERCRDGEDFANNPSEDLISEYRTYFNGCATSKKLQQTIQSTAYWTDGIMQRMSIPTAEPTPEAVEKKKKRCEDFRRRVMDNYDSPNTYLSVLAIVVPLTK